MTDAHPNHASYDFEAEAFSAMKEALLRAHADGYERAQTEMRPSIDRMKQKIIELLTERSAGNTALEKQQQLSDALERSRKDVASLQAELAAKTRELDEFAEHTKTLIDARSHENEQLRKKYAEAVRMAQAYEAKSNEFRKLCEEAREEVAFVTDQLNSNAQPPPNEVDELKEKVAELKAELAKQVELSNKWGDALLTNKDEYDAEIAELKAELVREEGSRDAWMKENYANLTKSEAEIRKLKEAIRKLERRHEAPPSTTTKATKRAEPEGEASAQPRGSRAKITRPPHETESESDDSNDEGFELGSDDDEVPMVDVN